MIDSPHGLYCEPGGFYIDPSRAVPRAVVTHAHSDHARRGCGRYLTSNEGAGVLQTRMGRRAIIDAIDYGRSVTINGVSVSLFPAGHVLGSAQIRLEYRGEVWVVSGDYKLDTDPSCRTYTPVRCNVFLTESTFGLPLYRWPEPQQVLSSINSWWRANRDAGLTTVILSYSLGKSQRILSELDASVGPIFSHPAVEEMNAAYRNAGIPLPPTVPLTEADHGPLPAGAMVIVPPGSDLLQTLAGSNQIQRAAASGWMQLRARRKSAQVDRTFVLSDHADWPGLNAAVRDSQAERVYVMHGQIEALVRWLTEQGIAAFPVSALRG